MPILGLTASSANNTPSVPTIGTATAGDAQATVAFTPGTVPGTTYRAISSPGGITATSSSSPITVTGLTNGTSYTFQVRAENYYGNSAYSASSNSVTPVLPKPTVTGGTLYSDATYYYRVFTSNGTLTVSGGTVSFEVLRIGGGASGAAGAGFISRGSGTGYFGGGGGAGGVVYTSSNTFGPESKTIVIGAGGAASSNGSGIVGNPGSDSTYTGLSNAGGGGGGGSMYTNTNGGVGRTANGNGGGAGWFGTYDTGDLIASGYTLAGAGNGSGFAGGSAAATGTATGGGGASESGSTDYARAGGDGTSTYSSWGLVTGTGENVSGTVWYAGGGTAADGGYIERGLGGGGSWSNASLVYDGISINGLANTGGGGSGNRTSSGPSGTGGSGIVIVRYTRSQVE